MKTKSGESQTASDNDNKTEEIEKRLRFENRINLNRRGASKLAPKKMCDKNKCEYRRRKKDSENEAAIWRECFTELRTQFRQMLYEKNIDSNPRVSDQWIIDELRKLLGIEDSPHRFLNFPR